MAFWKGIKKIFSGIEEIANSPSELLAEMKRKRRIALSGKYVVPIPAEYGLPGLVAHITFNGGTNMHDIDLLTYDGGSIDVWDEQSESTRVHVSIRINRFLSNLMEKHRASPYY